ncbi:MAG: MFS transporter [Verrucomicrobiota bacterium]|nr:MFS transporter [Verrucomicrobiota bacterium]
MQNSPAHPGICQPGRIHYGYVVLVLIISAVFVSLGLGRFGYTSVLPAMQDSMKLTNVQTGALQSWNLVGYLSTVVFAGMLASRFGPRVVITVSLLVAGAGMFITGLVPTYGGAQTGRFLAGVGGAGGNVPAMGLVSAWFGIKRRGLAAGTAVAGSSVGLMVTGPLVPWLLEMGGADRGWRLCWYVMGTMAFAVAVLCAFLLRNCAEEMGLKPIGNSADNPPNSSVRQPQSPVRFAEVWRSRVLWHLATIYFAFGFSYIIYATFFVRYLVKEMNFGASRAGTVWFLIGVVSGVSGFFWGAISDRWGRRAGLVSVFALQSCSFLVLGVWHHTPAVWISAALFALTAWSIPALMAALSGDVFGPKLAPSALGLMTIVFGAGQAMGPWLAGRVADATKSFAPAFALAGAIALVWGAGGSMLVRTKTGVHSHQG